MNRYYLELNALLQVTDSLKAVTYNQSSIHHAISCALGQTITAPVCKEACLNIPPATTVQGHVSRTQWLPASELVWHKASKRRIPAAQILIIQDLQALAGQGSGCSLFSRLLQLRWQPRSSPAPLCKRALECHGTLCWKALNGFQAHKGGSV